VGVPRAVASADPVIGVSTTAQWLVGAVILLTVSRLHQFFTPLGVIRAPFLMSLAALVSLATSTHRWRPGDLSKHWIPRGFGLIAAIAIIGVASSIYPGRSVDFLNQAYSRALLIGIMTWAVARTERGALFVARSLTVAGILAAVLALKAGRGGARLSGAASYDANDLALVAAVTVPLAMWWLLDRRNSFRWLVGASIPILILVVVRSDSRGGFLGLAAVVACLLFLTGPRMPPVLRRVSIAAAVLAVLSFPFLPAEYRGRIASIGAENDYNMTSVRGRKAVWTRGMGYALANPILGVGIANFRTAEGWSQPAQEAADAGRGWKWSAAHNSFIQITAELGFIAGLTFLWLVIRSIAQLLARGRRHGGPRTRGPPDLLAPMLGLSLVAYAVSGFFLSFAYYDLVYILFGLAAAVLSRPAAPSGRRIPQGRGRPAPRGGMSRVPGFPAAVRPS